MKVASSVYDVAWHPGQRDLLACATSTGGKILNMERPETEAVQLGTDGTYCVAWSPAGHLLVTLGKQNVVWNSHGARVATLLAQPGGWEGNPQFNGSGSLVAITRLKILVRECDVFDTLTGVLKHSLEIFGESIAWKDDRELFCCGGMGSITHLRIGQAEPLRIMTGASQFATTMAFNPEKDILAFGGRDGTVRLWSSGVTTLTGHTEGVRGLVWISQNSGFLASYSQDQVRIWDAIAETNLHVYEGFFSSSSNSKSCYGMSHISFSPDGQFFAAAGRFQNVKVIKVSTGKIVAECEENGIAVSWSRGNNKLAVKSICGPNIVDGVLNPVEEAVSVYNLENLIGINLKAMSMKCVASLLEKNLTNGKEQAKEFLTNERIPETLISGVLLMFHIKMY